MTSLRRALWCLAAAGFVFGVIDLALILTSDFAPHVMGPFGLVIGWGFIGAGLFAWSRRPDNRVGMLMAATGFAWLLAGLGLSDIPLLFALGSAFGSVYFATAVHMLLAAPSGRLQTRGERRIVATTYALTAAVVPAMLCPDRARPGLRMLRLPLESCCSSGATRRSWTSSAWWSTPSACCWWCSRW